MCVGGGGRGEVEVSKFAAGEVGFGGRAFNKWRGLLACQIWLSFKLSSTSATARFRSNIHSLAVRTVIAVSSADTDHSRPHLWRLGHCLDGAMGHRSMGVRV